MTDARERHPRLKRRVVHAELAQRLLHHGQLVGGVVDHEIARQADMGRLSPKEARAERMERRDPHLPAIGAEQRLDARPHLFRGLVGECDGEHAVRRRMPVGHEMCDAMRDDAGLSGTGAGENQQRSFGVKDRFLLFRVQA
jgi:hypothetical protein